MVLLAAVGIVVGVTSSGPTETGVPTGDVPASFVGSWSGRATARPGTGIAPRVLTVTIDGGVIGGRIGLYRYPQQSCDYDLFLQSVRPEGELIAAITVLATRTLSSPMSCTDLRVEFVNRDENTLTGNFDTISDTVGPTQASVGLQRVS